MRVSARQKDGIEFSHALVKLELIDVRGPATLSRGTGLRSLYRCEWASGFTRTLREGFPRFAVKPVRE